MGLANLIEGSRQDLKGLLKSYVASPVTQSPKCQTSSDYGGSMTPKDKYNEPTMSKLSVIPQWSEDTSIPGPTRLRSLAVESWSSKSTEPQSSTDMRPTLTPTHHQLPPTPSEWQFPSTTRDAETTDIHGDNSGLDSPENPPKAKPVTHFSYSLPTPSNDIPSQSHQERSFVSGSESDY